MQPVADTLEHWLRDRQLLLLLDNCEPVVEAVASFAEHYLAALPGCAHPGHEPRGSQSARRAGVERHRPSQSGTILRFPVIPTRSSSSWSGQPRLLRASMRRPLISPRSPQICRRLDGLPLAIELAAVRLRALSLQQIATRLDDRFRLLRAGERTLEAMVAWSYDLLTDAEREMFVRLAVFPADFSLDAAEMVVSDAVRRTRATSSTCSRASSRSRSSRR